MWGAASPSGEVARVGVKAVFGEASEGRVEGREIVKNIDKILSGFFPENAGLLNPFQPLCVRMSHSVENKWAIVEIKWAIVRAKRAIFLRQRVIPVRVKGRKERKS